MPIKYNYFNDKDLVIFVTDETVEITPYTFHKDGTMWETLSLKQFYSQIDKTNKSVIVDIGAQSGLYSLYAKYLPECTYYSFEPFPSTFKLLNDNLQLNNITNVKTFNIALSDKEGSAILNTSKSHNGLHTLGNNVKRFNDIVPIEIQTQTLDNIFYDNNIKVDYIKIDTEGGEYNILKGGINTIKKYRPIIQLEWEPINMSQANITESMMKDLMVELNYKCVASAESEYLFKPL